ncbi:MAG: DUF4097 family beta strand repeat protein [Pyrinomonadaceae bacterium]|nr:DUF4097 family beta strand repeat protein [Pyrinomonadaceae bacterium]
MSFLFAILFAGSIYTTAPHTEAPILQNAASVVSFAGDETDVKESSYPINPDGKVSLSNINGEVEVTGWDRPEVNLVTTKIASSRERLDDVDVKVTSRQDYFNVEVDYKKRKGKWVKNERLQVNFKLMVPRTALVDEIESVNGSVKVSSLSNTIKVSAVNGAVRGTGLTGKVNLATVNGSVLATFETLPADSDVRLSTVNGSTQIFLPSNSDATVKADSLNGAITNDFGLKVKKGKYVGRDLYGSIGAGTTNVRLTTVNGSIKIRRNDDGLPLNPVKNLLKQKTSDDFDETFDSAVEVGSAPKLAAEAARIATDSIKASKAIELEALRQSERIASVAVTADAESIEAAVGDVRAIEVDQDRLDAEIAAMTRSLEGIRSAPFIVEDSKSIRVEGIPNVVIDAEGCNVTVRGWDRDEVKYVVTRLAKGRTSPVRDISFSHNKTEVRLSVKVVGAASLDKVLEQVKVELYVPRESNLNIGTDREIRLVGVTGELDLNGKYGRIDVRDSGGALDIASWNGTVRVIGFDGKLDSRVGNADMYLDGDFQAITSYSKSGKVYLALSDDPGALISTNSMALDGVTMREGKTVLVNGMKVTHMSRDLWKIGAGESDYKFKFNKGALVVRPKNVLDTE